MRSMRGTASTGMNKMVSYGLERWNFWMRDWRFCNLLMAGIENPYDDRLFEGSEECCREHETRLCSKIKDAEEKVRYGKVLQILCTHQEVLSSSLRG